jgi:hypothetical protein
MACATVSLRSRPINDWIGQRFGRLTITAYAGRKYTSHHIFECRCDCGNIRYIDFLCLQRGTTKSCGCLRKQQTGERHFVHGHGRNGQQTTEYYSWANMIARCENPKDSHYKYYGGRGIKVHPSIRSFADFLAYMGPSNGLTLERPKVNGHYEPGNMIWLPKNEQSANRRISIKLIYNEKIIDFKYAITELNISKTAYYKLRKKGYSAQNAFDTLLRKTGY